uniref:Uncharacterized protein n=1 Tax=Haematobia irritans TaxID=7368 RepID=A0A1L8E9F7_HAEIR
MNTFENHLKRIDNNISISAADRQPYMEIFETVKSRLIAEMKFEDALFRELSGGTDLFGSYSNGVKLQKPDEFDVFIVLKFPENLLKISLDTNQPGYLIIQADRERFQNLQKLVGAESLRTLSSMFDTTLRLKENVFVKWLKDVIERAVERLQNNLIGYNISYQGRAVAQNLYVKRNEKRISFDFVPAILCDNITGVKESTSGNFYAIVKREFHTATEFSFLLGNPRAEHNLLWDKNNLKIVCRLIKALRDHYDMKRMKSYFITAIFLLEVELHPQNVYWQKSVDELFFHMLQRLCDYLNKRCLPYYWNRDLNLLSTLKPHEISQYSRDFQTAYAELWKYRQCNVPFETVATFFKSPK